MKELLFFAFWAVLIFLMMRFGCGAHVLGHGGHGKERGSAGPDDRQLRWVPPSTDVDPVCGKTVHTGNAKPTVHDGAVYYLCSRECRERFEASPEIYLNHTEVGGTRKLENSHV